MSKTVTFAVIAIIGFSDALSAKNELPCKFLDSHNITDGERYDDGTIFYQGVQYPSKLYAEIDYITVETDDGPKNVHVAPHLRGCLCEIKGIKCIRLCCPFGQFWDNENGYCQSHELANNFKSKVHHPDNEVETLILDHHFHYVHDAACSENSSYSAENHALLHSGEVLYKDKKFNHRSYCMLATYNESTNVTDLSVYTCQKPDDETRSILLACGMAASVAFIFTTMLVYVCLPELRGTVHGKCLLAYLMGLLLGYLSISVTQLANVYFEQPYCELIGYLIYFAFISAFLWLNVISFDAYWVFSSMNRGLSERKRFYIYMIYAWGLSLVLTGMLSIVNSIDSLPDYLQPGIGVGTCFFNKQQWKAQFVYFYLPMFIVISLNVIFFSLTAMKIYGTQRDLNKITSKDSNSQARKKLQNDKENFLLFLRLFIVMGVTWSMEPISWMISADSWWFFSTDFFNTLQGFVIFVLFVLKRRVLNLIRNRWRHLNGQQTFSNGTVESSIPLRTKSRFRSTSSRSN